MNRWTDMSKLRSIKHGAEVIIKIEKEKEKKTYAQTSKTKRIKNVWQMKGNCKWNWFSSEFQKVTHEMKAIEMKMKYEYKLFSSMDQLPVKLM